MPPVPPACSSRARSFLFPATLVLLLAAALRLWALDWLPGGLHFDLAAYLFDAVEVLEGARPVYFPRNTGREPFVIYLYALAAAALGPTPFAARLVTAFFGVLGVAALGFAARQALRLARPSDPAAADRAALLAAGLMAGLYWSVHFSRFGLRAAALPALLALAFGFLMRGIRRDLVHDVRHLRHLPAAYDFVLSGLLLGLALESYTAARLAPPAIVLPLVVAFLVQRRATWLGRLALVAGASALVFAPLALHFLRHPGDFGTHAYDNSVLNPAVNGGDPLRAALRAALATAAGYVVRGSPGAAENLPGRPLFDPLAAAAFLFGFVLLMGWLRGPLPRALAALTLLGWLAALSLSSAFSLPAPGFVRLSGATPAAVLVATLGAAAIVDRLARRRARAGPVLATALVLLPTLLTTHDYFVTWASGYRYRAAMVDKADAAAHLLAQPPGARLFLAPLWANDFGVQFLTRDRPLESFHLGAGAVIPTDPANPAVYAFPYEQTDAANALSRLLPGTPPVETLQDATGRYDVLRLIHFRPTPAVAPERPRRLEDGVAFAGAEVARQGGEIVATLRWFATARPSRDYTVFVQLRDERGTAAQHDGTPVDGSVPTGRWHPGDVVLDRHVLKAPADATTGRYRLYAGMYDPASGRRLKLLDERGQPAPIDELLLGQL